MSKYRKIPVHRMEERFSGIFMEPITRENISSAYYEISKPHRHDFYYCLLIEKGNIDLSVDFKSIRITDQSLFLSYPGQVHHVNSGMVERGWFLAFDHTLIDEQLRNILDQFLSEVILLPLSPEQSAWFFSLLDVINAVYGNSLQAFRQMVTQSLVTAFSYQAASLHLSREKFNLIRHSARTIEITKSFRQLLRRNLRTMKRPAEFAGQLNISVTYLNDTVRSVTGFPVTYYIHQELIREAQRLLYHSNLSVKEISDSLGFEDAKYFNRLFSKVAGISPGAFRKNAETTVHI